MTKNKLGGVKAAADSIKGLKKEEQVNLLAKIALEDPNLAKEIKKYLFQFEDLSGLTPEDFRKLQKLIEKKTLYAALRKVSDDFKKQLRNLLSTRQYDLLWDEVSNVGPQRLSEVEKCQEEIVNIALEAAKKGEIALPSKWSKDVYVA